MSPTTGDRDAYEERERRLSTESGEPWTGTAAGVVALLAGTCLVSFLIYFILSAILAWLAR